MNCLFVPEWLPFMRCVLDVLLCLIDQLQIELEESRKRAEDHAAAMDAVKEDARQVRRRLNHCFMGCAIQALFAQPVCAVCRLLPAAFVVRRCIELICAALLTASSQLAPAFLPTDS